MGVFAGRLKQRAEAKSALADLRSNEHVLAIHYSCESFYDRKDGSSPRITSIAVRDIASGQTRSFSIHQVAERETQNPQVDEDSYDRFEKQMLEEFYEFVERHESFIWVHWNMRDINFGFHALAHRYRVLGGTPIDIHDSMLVDLARLIVGIYGHRYVDHPRLTNLVARNEMSTKDFMTGELEAKAFQNRDYAALHQSTLRKVDIFCGVLERLQDGRRSYGVKGRFKTGHEWAL